MANAQSRRGMLGNVAKLSAALALRSPLATLLAPASLRAADPDHERLASWADTLRSEGLTDPKIPLARAAVRGGTRGSFASRLHYFSEWISDGARRGLLRDIAPSLGAEDDTRPLRLMTEHRKSYVGLTDDKVYDQIATMERSLDGHPRHVIPTAHIAAVSDRIQTGDV